MNYRLKNSSGRQHSSVTVNFYRILTCVGMRLAHHQYQNLVYFFSVIGYVTVMNRILLLIRQPFPFFS